MILTFMDHSFYLLLVNPNNPTGTEIEQEQIERVIHKCEDHDVLLIIDEAYFYFYDKTSIRWVNQFDNIIVLRTFSKLCGLASLRLGYAAANPEIIKNIIKVKPTFDVNGVAVKLAEKVLENPEIIKQQIKTINEGKRFLVQRLEENGVEYRMGHANFVLIKCLERNKDIVKLLANHKILVAGGFKQDMLKNYIRVTLGSVELMDKFFDTFINILKKK